MQWIHIKIISPHNHYKDSLRDEAQTLAKKEQVPNGKCKPNIIDKSSQPSHLLVHNQTIVPKSKDHMHKKASENFFLLLILSLQMN